MARQHINESSIRVKVIKRVIIILVDSYLIDGDVKCRVLVGIINQDLVSRVNIQGLITYKSQTLYELRSVLNEFISLSIH